MTKRTIVLPTADNDGAPLVAEIASLEGAILDLAGGFTASDTFGVWRDDDGTVYRDASRTYTVTTDDATDARLAALLPSWATLLRQESLYTDTAAVAVSFASAA